MDVQNATYTIILMNRDNSSTRQLIGTVFGDDTIEDNSSTLFEDNSSTHLFEYNLQLRENLDEWFIVFD